MSYFLVTPALVLNSLKARARGQKPHLPALDCHILRCVERGSFSKLTEKDFAEARTIQCRNNRHNAEAARRGV
jgi:hypothetical protein